MLGRQWAAGGSGDTGGDSSVPEVGPGFPGVRSQAAVSALLLVSEGLGGAALAFGCGRLYPGHQPSPGRNSSQVDGGGEKEPSLWLHLPSPSPFPRLPQGCMILLHPLPAPQPASWAAGQGQPQGWEQGATGAGGTWLPPAKVPVARDLFHSPAWQRGIQEGQHEKMQMLRELFLPNITCQDLLQVLKNPQAHPYKTLIFCQSSPPPFF